MRNMQIKVVGSVMATCGLIVLIAYLTSRPSKPTTLPLTERQQFIAERLEATVRGDLVYDARSDKAWRVMDRRGKEVIILAHNETISPSIYVDKIARWADVVTNGLSEDPQYCRLAELHLTRED